MQVAVGEDDKAAVLGTGVSAGLLFADERVFVFGFGFEDDEGEAAIVEQQKVDKAFARFLKVAAKRVEVGGFDGDGGFEADVGRAAGIGEEAPAGGLEQVIDFDAGGGFFGHWRLQMRARQDGLYHKEQHFTLKLDHCFQSSSNFRRKQ